MTEKELEKLVRYLKENNAYVSYRQNIDDPSKYYNCARRRYNSTEEFLKEIEFRRSINCAFYWMNTEEGDAFWRNLSNKLRL